MAPDSSKTSLPLASLLVVVLPLSSVDVLAADCCDEVGV